MIALQVIFFLLVFFVFHTYVGYPLLLSLLAKNKKFNFKEFEEKPKVSILMALFNEESVIEDKLKSILSSSYPQEKIEIIIGSDNSSDKTNSIVKEFSEKYKPIQFFEFTERQGKPNIINQLVQHANSEIMILTDANVFFDNKTIEELIIPFSNPQIGLVDAKMINTGLKKTGISIQEKAYISREVKIKHNEGLLWGTMIGPFGGCFAIRKKLYSPVPKNFTVDDFYICMAVLKSGYKTVNSLNAIVFEDVSNNISDEFKRKIRIATGNFQNLNTFKAMLLPKHLGLTFSFLSHKVLRWLVPVFIIIAYILNFILAFEYEFYLVTFVAFNFVFFLSLVDLILKNINYHNKYLRFVTHFLSMNLALLIGMFKAMKGVKTNVWKPTTRNQ